MRSLVLLLVVGCGALAADSTAQRPSMLEPTVTIPKLFSLLRTSGASSLYTIDASNTTYDSSPLLLKLEGNHTTIGYDYAALLHEEASDTIQSFLNDLASTVAEQSMIIAFIDYLWEEFLEKHTPSCFLEELDGMQRWDTEHKSGGYKVSFVSRAFYTLANMPADTQNIISMLEQENEKKWPEWLKRDVNAIISILEKLVHSCDAFGVWGSRTEGGLLFSSRNLDYNSNTGINRHKLVTMFKVVGSDGKPVPGGTYTTLGFAFGPGALAGMNSKGITTSEMNLDNSQVTFDGLAFPLRLRYVLENAYDLESAMTVWNATNNTNSFNFLVGSASDAISGSDGAYALETILGFTAQFGANSGVEQASTYECRGTECHKWTNQTGTVHIGKPLPEAVWRTNHGLHPTVLATQEPLFNNTVFRYNLMHDLFDGLQQADAKISDKEATGITATLGIKGDNYFTCDQELAGDNTLSVTYAPGNRTAVGESSEYGYLYVAWESGSVSWKPASCSTYIRIDMDRWV